MTINRYRCRCRRCGLQTIVYSVDREYAAQEALAWLKLEKSNCQHRDIIALEIDREGNILPVTQDQEI